MNIILITEITDFNNKKQNIINKLLKNAKFKINTNKQFKNLRICLKFGEYLSLKQK